MAVRARCTDRGRFAREELRFNELEVSAASAGVVSKPGATGAEADKPQDLGSLKAERQDCCRSIPMLLDVRAVKRKIAVPRGRSGAGGEMQ